MLAKLMPKTKNVTGCNFSYSSDHLIQVSPIMVRSCLPGCDLFSQFDLLRLTNIVVPSVIGLLFEEIMSGQARSDALGILQQVILKGIEGGRIFADENVEDSHVENRRSRKTIWSRRQTGAFYRMKHSPGK
jgi:hypothetical protein